MLVRLPARLPARLAACLILTALAANGAARAQETGSIDRERQRDELSRLESEASISRETLARLESEVKAIETDTLKLRADFVETGRRMRETETALLATEARIQSLAANEETVKASLLTRRETLIDVIATLQRMGRRPPPAMLVRPDDALAAIRTAMLLGTVLPEMRAETQALAADLEELVRVRREIDAESAAMKQQLIALAEDRKRLNLLLEGRQALQSERQEAIDAERRRANDIGQAVSSLKELITRMESEVSSVKGAADAAAKAEETRTQLSAIEDPARMVPARAFEKTKGTLPLPASGLVLRVFGSIDAMGAEQMGQSIATRPAATVSSPCDGWVMFAGPFRSYGNLLIIDAGDGYHVLLAGMERIDVNLGQFVLAGEPVGVMGSAEAKVATAAEVSVGQPTLYIEFRKDNVSIDPAPWWSRQGEKARG